jgi:hypothetical protein
LQLSSSVSYRYDQIGMEVKTILRTAHHHVKRLNYENLADFSDVLKIFT